MALAGTVESHYVRVWYPWESSADPLQHHFIIEIDGVRHKIFGYPFPKDLNDDRILELINFKHDERS